MKKFKNLLVNGLNTNLILIRWPLKLFSLILVYFFYVSDSYSQHSDSIMVSPYADYTYNHSYIGGKSYYAHTPASNNIGYQLISGNDYRIYRRALNFELYDIPDNSTITGCYINFGSGIECGDDDGTLVFTEIPFDFPTEDDDDAFALIKNGTRLDSIEIDAQKNYKVILNELTQEIQNIIQEEYELVGIGIFNKFENSFYGTNLSGPILTVVYSDPTPGAPTALATSSITSTSMVLQWTPPPGSVTGYYEYVNGNPYTSTTYTSVTISGLCPGDQVTLKVIPYNGYGNGVESEEINRTTLENYINGDENLCSSRSPYEVINLPSGHTITWNNSDNITRISAQGSNPCNFQSNGYGVGWITATTVGSWGETLEKEVNVGTPYVHPEMIEFS